MHRKRLPECVVIGLLGLAAFACNANSGTTAGSKTPIVVLVTLEETVQAGAQAMPATSPERSQKVTLLLEQVSAENLMAHVEALAAIHTRHVNSQTIEQAAIYIFDAFESAGGNWQVAYDDFPLTYNGVQSKQRPA